MGYGAIPTDPFNIPIAAIYVPGVGWVALQGSPTTETDGQGNSSTPLSIDLAQINDEPVIMGGNDNVPADDVLEVLHGRFNGQTVDQDRGNLDTITIISSASYTTTQTSATLTNYNHRGCIVVLQTTAIGSGSITLSINGIEPVTSYTWTILAGTAVTTNTTVLYKIYPGLTAVANSVASDLLPRSWQVVVTANNANAATYGVYGIILL